MLQPREVEQPELERLLDCGEEGLARVVA